MKGSNLSAHRGLKNDCFEIENLRCVVVQLFVHMYHHFVLLYGELDFVYGLVLRLQYLRVVNF